MQRQFREFKLNKQMSARALNDNVRYNEPLALRLARKPRSGDDADEKSEKQKQRRKQSAPQRSFFDSYLHEYLRIQCRRS